MSHNEFIKLSESIEARRSMMGRRISENKLDLKISVSLNCPVCRRKMDGENVSVDLHHNGARVGYGGIGFGCVECKTLFNIDLTLEVTGVSFR